MRPAPERIACCLFAVVGFLTLVLFLAWLAGRIVGS